MALNPIVTCSGCGMHLTRDQVGACPQCAFNATMAFAIPHRIPEGSNTCTQCLMTVSFP